MCGRYTLRTAPVEYWPEEQLDRFAPRYNIAPTDSIAAVRVEDGQPRLVMLRWGLIPSWSRDEKIGYRTLNARAETIGEKPAFRAAFEQRRCLVLADGYYEWKAVAKKKQPFFIRMRDDRPFAFAGLWERWYGPSGARLERPLESCTIITTDANPLTAPVHDRMPVILRRQDHEFWLDPEFRSQPRLKSLLEPYSSDEMLMDAVSRLVNKVGNDAPECVEPIQPAE